MKAPCIATARKVIIRQDPKYVETNPGNQGLRLTTTGPNLSSSATTPKYYAQPSAALALGASKFWLEIEIPVTIPSILYAVSHGKTP